MALSLQDQLLKAGLADKKKAKQIKQAKHKQRKAKQKNKIETVDENKQAAEQAIEQKKARDRELNQQRQQEAEKKAIAAQIKQLIEVNKQSKTSGEGEVVCNFTDGTVVKRMHVSQAVNNDISKGKLTIVRLGDGYELVPTPVADKIAERDESFIVHRADDQKPASQEKDDWYADYEIPDDLTW